MKYNKQALMDEQEKMARALGRRVDEVPNFEVLINSFGGDMADAVEKLKSTLKMLPGQQVRARIGVPPIKETESLRIGSYRYKAGKK